MNEWVDGKVSGKILRGWYDKVYILGRTLWCQNGAVRLRTEARWLSRRILPIIQWRDIEK